MNTPNLRFPQFSGGWETTKLGAVATFSKGANISKNDIVENGTNEAIRYGELYTEYNEVIHDIKSKTNLPLDSLVLSRKNDVIIPASGETHIDIATASCVLKDNVALGGDTNIIRSKNNGVFLAYYLNNAKKIDIARLAQGVSVIHLYSSNLKQLLLNLPDIEEQQRIASFLTAVDDKIAGMAKKVKLLKKYKKGVMHKIFAQEIRFKDENGKDYPEWEEKRLGEVAYSETSPLSANEIEGKSGRYKVYGASGELQTLDTYHYEEEYIAIVKDGAGVGRISYCDPKSSVLGTMIVVQPKGKVDKKFLYYLLHQVDFKKYTTGSTIPHVYFRQYSKEEFGTPSITEQQKIAAFLTAIDDKIALEERRLQQAKWFKKSLLQQMFV